MIQRMGLLLLLTAILALCLAACSSNEETTPTATDATTETVDEATAPEAPADEAPVAEPASEEQRWGPTPAPGGQDK